MHSQNAIFSLPSTIYDQLSPHERKVSHVITRFSSALSMRQQLFLNLALRRRLNSEYADWKRLHLAPESPFKG